MKRSTDKAPGRRTKAQTIAWARAAGRRIGLEIRALVEQDQRALASDMARQLQSRRYSARGYPL